MLFDEQRDDRECRLVRLISDRLVVVRSCDGMKKDGINSASTLGILIDFVIAGSVERLAGIEFVSGV